MKKIFSLVLIVCLFCSFDTFDTLVLANESHSTKVHFEGGLESYWELDVPSSMKPGETKEVILVGNWDTGTAFSLDVDESVILGNDIGDSTKELSIDFTPINQVGDLTNTISITRDISIETMGGDYFGTWEGIFNYYLSINDAFGHYGVIPEGGTYYIGVTGEDVYGRFMAGDYAGATEILTAGDKFPLEVNDGDIYVYGDYEYRYNMFFNGIRFCSYGVGDVSVGDSEAPNCWSVTVVDRRKEVYGNILRSINGKQLKDMSWSFYECNKLVTAPVIPNTVTDLNGAFWSCDSLVTASIIPESVINMDSTFHFCYSLITAPTIPKNVINIEDIFCDCPSLTGVVVINSNPIKYNSWALSGAGAWVENNSIILTGLCPREKLEEIASDNSNIIIK